MDKGRAQKEVKADILKAVKKGNKKQRKRNLYNTATNVTSKSFKTYRNFP